MTANVSDKFSNFNDNLAHAARILRHSEDRRKLFEAIYRGKKAVKTQDELSKATGLTSIRILQEAGKLYANDLIGRVKVNGCFAYQKVQFFTHHKDKVLRLASDSKKLKALPTKTNPSPSLGSTVTIRIPARAVKVAHVTVDDIDSFAKVKGISTGQQMKPIAESLFKKGIKKIVGQKGKFTDWGGEKNDLFTTRMQLKGKRIACAFAFKGKGKRGILKPKDFGKNGDQIQRLFQSDAELFLLQYWHQLDQAVYELMRICAVAKSVSTGDKIYYGIIDGGDTRRLKMAYPKAFK